MAQGNIEDASHRPTITPQVHKRPKTGEEWLQNLEAEMQRSVRLAPRSQQKNQKSFEASFDKMQEAHAPVINLSGCLDVLGRHGHCFHIPG